MKSIFITTTRKEFWMVLYLVMDIRFILAGNEEFLDEITDKIRGKLDISKLEDKEFGFKGINVTNFGESIEISMDDYVKSLKILYVRDGKPYQALTREELKSF